MIDVSRQLKLCLLVLFALATSCGTTTVASNTTAVSDTSATGSTAAPPAANTQLPRPKVTKVTFLRSKDPIKSRDCVAVGRVTARGSDVENDLKDQSRALGGNYVVVNAYTYKRMNLGYAVKGVAYYCY